MSDLIKTLKQIALRKRDEKGEQGKRVSEKGFVEWKAADALEAKDKRVAELEAERDFAIDHRNTARDKVEEVLATNERLREFLERGGIDSSAVLAGEDDGTWQDENERQATLIRELNEHYGGQADEIERLTAVYEAAKTIHYKQVAASASEFVDLQEALAAVGEKDDE